MIKYLLLSILFLPHLLIAQQTNWATEFQTSFIDISGLFGLDEPAQVTMLSYQKKGLYIEGFHSFSWQEPGLTIQTFFTAGYQFVLGKEKSKSLSIGNGFAFNRVASNGSFLRPILTLSWDHSDRQTISIVGWMFLDTRKETAQPLNGATGYVGHVYKLPFTKIEWSNEFRVLYSHIHGVRNVAGFTEQLKLILNPSNVYFFVNSGYSFYRSDHKTEIIYNLGLGKRF